MQNKTAPQAPTFDTFAMATPPNPSFDGYVHMHISTYLSKPKIPLLNTPIYNHTHT